ncbi:MAG TPA: dihydrofolate reductase [Bacteroidales bacterium]|jgi:dihydrofolate reductase|nr:dihydrofolate reductase [Bacteroidales bacterium]
MAQIKLYIACSLDGYIARENHSLDWLNNFPNPDNSDYGYHAFIQNIDILVMGRKTYDEIMGFDVDWPYKDYKTFVLTSQSDFKVLTTETYVLNAINAPIIEQLKSASSKNIWIVGGSKVIAQFINLNALDEMMIFMIPVVLGSGISLFADKIKETPFKLIKAESYKSGAVMLSYTRK